LADGFDIPNPSRSQELMPSFVATLTQRATEALPIMLLSWPPSKGVSPQAA
jgi:hypothetical protein